MALIPGSSSERTTTNRKISALFADELKMLIFAFTIAAVCLEIVLINNAETVEISKDSFLLAFMGFFAFYCALEYVFRMFAGKEVSAILSLLPALLLYLLLGSSLVWSDLKYAVLAAALIRLMLVFIPWQKYVITYGGFVVFALSLYLYFALDRFKDEGVSSKLLFVFLVLLILSAFQRRFPFFYFVILGIIVVLIPVKQEPIDWTPVARIGERIVEKVQDISYYMPYQFQGDSFTAGYSSFHITGEKNDDSKSSQRTEIILRTADKPYYSYIDKESGKSMMVRRTLYLSGGKGADKAQFIRFINFLHENEVTREVALLFSTISNVNITYAYINTKDEIAPANSFYLETNGKELESGVSEKSHKKGYEINAKYVEIDYGSPYLMALFSGTGERRLETAGTDANNFAGETLLSYDEAIRYVRELYGLNLASVLDENEYDSICASLDLGNSADTYLDTSGCSQRMQELAGKLTSEADSTYDKCRLIEKYLRQYTYSTDAEGGYNESSDMGTAAGMADIAERFLFDTGKGYCVHYASSMIMLLRLCGIPARASYGYYYAYPFDVSDFYEVYGNCAHTWPEAYIDGVGWVPFEPTAGYHDFADFSWHRMPKEEPKEEAALAVNEGASMYIPTIPEYMTEEDEEEEQDEQNVVTETFRIAIPVAISILILLVIIISGSFLVRILHYKYAEPAEKLRIDVEQIKKEITRKSTDKFTDRGLLSDYVSRAPEELRQELEVVFATFYRSVYGTENSGEISPKENEMARNLRDRLAHIRK